MKIKDINKKSNKELLELKVKLREDYEFVRLELLKKSNHWSNIKENYSIVIKELKDRGIEI